MRALGPTAIGTFLSRPGPGLFCIDARDISSLRRLVTSVGPDVVFFPAAEPNVDWCESHPDEARAANVTPARNALEVANECCALFVFFSSDYVFDGAAGPYEEDTPVMPLSVYGTQKREVEEVVLESGGTVIRTTTVFGTEPPPGKNFVLRVVAALSEGRVMQVPSDQWSTPTFSDDLALAAVAAATHPGIWHVAGPEFVARDAFARTVAAAFELDGALIRDVPTVKLHQLARRPLRGGLRGDKVIREFGLEFMSTVDALAVLRERLSALARRDPMGARGPAQSASA